MVSPQKFNLKDLDRNFLRVAVYFFLRIMEITRVMIETIRIPNVNKSFTVMYSIGNAPFRGLNLTAYYTKRWEKFCNQ